MSENPFESEKTSSFSLEELQSRIRSVDSAQRHLLAGMRGVEHEVSVDEIVNGLVSDLLKEKDRFSKVCVTDRGSTYFILNSGQSLRIRKESASSMYQSNAIQPIHNQIYFVSSETAYSLSRPKKPQPTFELYLGAIPLNDYKVGAVPLEFNRIDLPSDLVTLASDNGKLMPSGKLANRNALNDGIHIGTKITQILK